MELSRKKALDDRFKNRGKKRPAPEGAAEGAGGDTSSSSSAPGGSGKKKIKELCACTHSLTFNVCVESLTTFLLHIAAYEKEVAEINKRAGLSDEGAGVRSLVK